MLRESSATAARVSAVTLVAGATGAMPVAVSAAAGTSKTDPRCGHLNGAACPGFADATSNLLSASTFVIRSCSECPGR